MFKKYWEYIVFGLGIVFFIAFFIFLIVRGTIVPQISPIDPGGDINVKVMQLSYGIIRLEDSYGVCYVITDLSGDATQLECFGKIMDVNILQLQTGGVGGGNGSE